MEISYLEKIYNKSKADGHFSKFETYQSFSAYFKSNEDFIKLYKFLESKAYKIPSVDEFVKKCSDISFNNEKTKVSKNTLVQPVAAIGDLSFDNTENLKLPDLLKVGTLRYHNSEFNCPALIPFSTSKGILFITSDEAQKKKANIAMQEIAFRLILSVPIKQSYFYIIDSEGNGQSFSNMFGLDKKIVEEDIWDDEHEIVKGLQDIKNIVPKIISENLTTKYADLAEYNNLIPHSNQPFRFIMIANFPKGFNNDAFQHLLSLMKNGSKAGVFIIASYDEKAKLEFNFNPSEIRNISIEYNFNSNKFFNLPSEEYFNSKFFFTLDNNLPKNLDTIKEKLNTNINQIQKVNIDISSELKGKLWTGNTSKGIKIPIGVSNNNTTIFLDFSDESGVHHAMIGGSTGSGKTVLQHNIIVNSAQIYSPEDLQFVLMDYKEGTEFKIYKNLPHIKVLSIDSKREFGLSVFDFLVKEISDRGRLFKEFNTGNLEGYCNASGKKIPRILVIIDEFQVLLNESDTISSNVATLMEDVARRGRSFGINLILATQTLSDVAINSSTLNQLGLRIAMKMSENDCMRLLSFNNDLPKTFDRPGQALYNAKQGQKDGNIEFQVAYMSNDNVLSRIESVIELKNKRKEIETDFKRYLFDGSAIANIHENLILNKNINNNTFTVNDNFCSLYIGEPAFIQEEHIKFKIRKQQESNVLISGDSFKAAIGVIYYSFFQLIKQSSAQSKFYIFDTFDIDSGYAGSFENLKQESDNIKIYSKSKPLENLITELSEELAKRFEDEGSPGRIVVALLNIHKFKDLRKDENAFDYPENTTKLFKLIKDGPDYGIHFFIHGLNYNGLMTLLEQKHLKEFENVIILKGEDPEKHTDSYGIKPLKEESMAYLKSPDTKYSLDLLKIYFKD